MSAEQFFKACIQHRSVLALRARRVPPRNRAARARKRAILVQQQATQLLPKPAQICARHTRAPTAIELHARGTGLYWFSNSVAGNQSTNYTGLKSHSSIICFCLLLKVLPSPRVRRSLLGKAGRIRPDHEQICACATRMPKRMPSAVAQRPSFLSLHRSVIALASFPAIELRARGKVLYWISKAKFYQSCFCYTHALIERCVAFYVTSLLSNTKFRTGNSYFIENYFVLAPSLHRKLVPRSYQVKI